MRKMRINDLLDAQNEWLRGTGPMSGIALSTRVRLARNVKGDLYFDRADADQRENTLEKLFTALQKADSITAPTFLRMKDLSGLDRLFLVERHLMSREHAGDTAHKGLVIGKSETISVMVNEEDHLRMQVMKPGFDIFEAWKTVDALDTELSEHVQFDYSNKFGYLTSCPTNTGTGLRASVMLHLPALVMSNEIDVVFKGISKLGLTMRGFYGEGTESLGDFFQISNQVSLGHSEIDVLDNLQRIINKVIAREKETRQNFLSEKKPEVMDRIARAYGTLKNARIITSSETIKLLSVVRLGLDLEFIKEIDLARINEILLLTQPAHIQKFYDLELGSHDRDVKRADLIREKLKTEG
ncbi:MAG: protein arginine kinase [Candidatus Omnitrophica bacterium]|nr:protein arginine kinase [Candidatus Omnitrophota bacterium]